VFNDSPVTDIFFPLTNFFHELDPVDNGLVSLNIKKDRGAFAVMGYDQRAVGFVNLIDEGRDMGSKLGQRADILSQLNSPHEGAPLCTV
jgi:hypothetical protein